MLLNGLYDTVSLAVWSYGVVLSHGGVTLQHDAEEDATVYLNAMEMLFLWSLENSWPDSVKVWIKNCLVIYYSW